MKYCKLLLDGTGKYYRADNIKSKFYYSYTVIKDDHLGLIVKDNSNTLLVFKTVIEDYFSAMMKFNSITDWCVRKVSMNFMHHSGITYEMNSTDFMHLVEIGIDIRKPITGKWSLIKYSGGSRLVYREDL